MRTKLWMLAFSLITMTSAWAAPPEVIILPIEMPGYFTPMDSEVLTKDLQAGLHKLAPQAGLQVSRAADLTAYGYTAGGDQPPSMELADKLCRAYSASHVCWVSIRFQPDFQASSGALALAGAARLWVYSSATRKVSIDQPVSVVRVGQVANPADQKAAQAVGRTLAEGCVSDLANQIVGIARQRSAQPPTAAAQWTAPRDYEASKSAAYKSMVASTQSYQKAMKNNSLVDITTSQAAMTSAWAALNGPERKAIGDNYPGIVEFMTATPVYNYGGGYWPYR